MFDAFVSVLITAGLCGLVFLLFGAAVGYLYIAERRRVRSRRERASAAAGTASGRSAAEERRRRRRAQFPDALPAPSDALPNAPALGNVLIKDEALLALLRRDLVEVRVPSVLTGSAGGGGNSAAACSDAFPHRDEEEEEDAEEMRERETREDAQNFMELLDTSAMPVGDSARSVTVRQSAASVATPQPVDSLSSSPSAPSQRLTLQDFNASLLSGGFVIVEREVSLSLSAIGGRSEASAGSTVGPREAEEEDEEGEGEEDTDMMQLDEETAAVEPAKVSFKQYFRFQRPSSPYGRARYLPSEDTATKNGR